MRFALRPRWIAGHVLVLVAIVVMVNLGLWQLRRLDERREANALVRERAQAPVVRLTGADDRIDVDALEFRRVEVTGTFDASHEVLVGYRSSNGLPGYHVVTPLEIDGATAVLVNRGFVPLALAERWPATEAAAPEGEVTVVGVARRGGDAATEIAGKDAVPRLNAVDIQAIDRYTPDVLLPMHIELQRPAPAGFPDPLPDLDLGEGPHLSYAAQWFAFSIVLFVGWMAVLRRATRRTGQPLRASTS